MTLAKTGMQSLFCLDARGTEPNAPGQVDFSRATF
jgi:hypothetical protein